MKQITCPCGAEFKTHTEDELVAIASVHVEKVHKSDFPQGLSREEAVKMIKDV